MSARGGTGEWRVAGRVSRVAALTGVVVALGASDRMDGGPLSPPEDDTLDADPATGGDDVDDADADGDAEGGRLVELSPAKVLLVAANLLPAYGVLFLGWDVFVIVFLYWLENVAVGVFAALRMLFNARPEEHQWLEKAVLVPFFIVHYGGFALVHGLFVLAMFGQENAGGDLGGMSWRLVWGVIRDHGLVLPAVALVASHAFSFVWNYLIKGECRRTFLMQEQARPYRRVVVLHVAIIGGGFLIQALGQPVLMLLVLVLLKTGMDLFAHSRSHRRAQVRQRRHLERLYRLVASAGQAATAAEGGVADSLQQRFPGYVRDRRAESWRRRPCAWLSIGGLAVAIGGGISIAAGAAVLGGVGLGVGIVSFITGVVLYNIRRRVPCSVCGRSMVIVETGMTPAEMTRGERLASGGTPIRAEQRWYVCHPCRRYWRAWKMVQTSRD